MIPRSRVFTRAVPSGLFLTMSLVVMQGHATVAEDIAIPVKGVILQVGKEKEAKYTSIQAAIHAAPEGATVRIGPGTFEDGIVIRKPLILEARAGTRPRSWNHNKPPPRKFKKPGVPLSGNFPQPRPNKNGKPWPKHSGTNTPEGPFSFKTLVTSKFEISRSRRQIEPRRHIVLNRSSDSSAVPCK